ncbi:MAG: hypothetical protein V7K67_08050 [Nostoc sp.]|uniref:hypothetical protein n=1 Tax=Nostoc sp. TaxID=1180 RepID=UPI002FF3164F
MKRDGVSHDVSMCPCTNPLILIMGISLLPVARSLFPFNALLLDIFIFLKFVNALVKIKISRGQKIKKLLENPKKQKFLRE